MFLYALRGIVDSSPPLPVNPYAPPAVLVDTPAPAPAEPLARASTRFKARLVDHTLALAVAIPGLLVVAVTERTAIGFSLAGVAVLGLLVYQWSHIVKTGQSLGKRWCRLRVVRREGQPVTFVSGVLLREWIPFALGLIPTLGSVVGLVDAIFIFRADRRCLHDHLAGTKVITVR
jgi:uncharacterized RDD family membrane protein YckC